MRVRSSVQIQLPLAIIDLSYTDLPTDDKEATLSRMGSILSVATPVSQDDLEQVKEKATEMMKSFGIKFSINFAKCLATWFLESARSAGRADDSSRWKLPRRPWESVTRTELFSGQCYMKTGEGPGIFGKWKQKFVVERQDYKIDVFLDESTYQSGGKPTTTISLIGYEVIESSAVEYYLKWLSTILEEKALTEKIIEKLVPFTSHSWALAHKNRTNYVMQLDEPNSKDCKCKEDRQKWIDFLKRCKYREEQLRETSVISDAFDMTFEAMKEEYEQLKNEEADGTEGEKLTQMLLKVVFDPLLPVIKVKIMGSPLPVSKKLTIWYTVMGMVRKTLSNIADQTWKVITDGEKTVRDKLEPKLKPVLEKIGKLLNTMESKLQELLTKPLGNLIDKHPFKPLVDSLRQPMTSGFQQGRKLIVDKVDLSKLPSDANSRNAILDAIPRTTHNLQSLKVAAAAVSKVTESLSEDKSAVVNIQFISEDALLRMLDSAMFAVQQRLDAGSPKPESGALLKQVLSDYDHDVQHEAMADFLRVALTELIVEPMKQAFETLKKSKQMAPAMTVIKALDDAIPNEVKEFLSVESTMDRFVESFIRDRIERAATGSSSSDPNVQPSPASSGVNGAPPLPISNRPSVSQRDGPPATHPRQNSHSSPVDTAQLRIPRPTSVHEGTYLSNYAWYFGNITREVANALLREHIDMDGVFLVRHVDEVDAARPRPYCLSFNLCGRQWHSLISLGAIDRSMFCIEDSIERMFRTLPDLIQFYRRNSFGVDVGQRTNNVTLTFSPEKLQHSQ